MKKKISTSILINALKFYANPNGIWAERICDCASTPTIDAEHFPEEYGTPGHEARRVLSKMGIKC